MAFSDADKQFILGQLAYDASAFVTREYGEEAAQEFFILFSAGFTKEEWQAIMNLNKTIDAVFARRRFELNRMMFKPEHLDEMYKKGFPSAVDFSHIPEKTLQLGLLLSWQETRTIKLDDEPDEKFERRKDLHDYLFGCVNQEAVANPLINFDIVGEEVTKQREKLQNYVDIIHRKWGDKNGVTPGTG